MGNQYTKIKNELDNVVHDIECCLISGLSVNEISILLDYGYSAVYNCIIRNGLKHYVSIKNIGKGNRYDEYYKKYENDHSLTKDVLFDCYWNKLMNLYEIADMFNVSASGVLYRLKKYDIKTRKTSEASKLMYERKPELREIHRKNANNGITGIFKKGNKYNNTSIERLFEEYCKLEDLVYNRQFQIYTGGHRYDFLVNGIILVEVDGVYWHDKETQIIKDNNHDKEASENGYFIIRFTDIQIKKTKGECFNEIKRYIE